MRTILPQVEDIMSIDKDLFNKLIAVSITVLLTTAVGLAVSGIRSAGLVEDEQIKIKENISNLQQDMLSLTNNVNALTNNVNLVVTDIAVIKGNRFTSKDAQLSFDRLYNELSAVKTTIAKLPTEVPPAWFIARVDGIEKRMDAVDKFITTNLAPNKPPASAPLN